MTLNLLERDQSAKVVGLSAEGAERRRLMDLGFVPGASVEVEMGNPLGDPRAFRIMGAVVALRRDQARTIEIQLNEEAN